jgi:hypothetical protein
MEDLEALNPAETWFDPPETLASFSMPDPVIREVAADPRFAAASLVSN